MKTKNTPIADTYLALVQRHPLRPIRTAAQHEASVEIARSIMLRRTSDAGERDYLGTLTTLIDAYERQAMPVKAGEAHDRLKFVVEESGTSQAEFGRILGVGQSAVSLILSGKRGLSVQAVKRLADHFRISASYFL